MRQLKLVRIDNNIKNIRNKYRKLAAESLNALMIGLTKPITNALNIYKSLLHELHPYEVHIQFSAESTLIF